MLEEIVKAARLGPPNRDRANATYRPMSKHKEKQCYRLAWHRFVELASGIAASWVDCDVVDARKEDLRDRGFVTRTPNNLQTAMVMFSFSARLPFRCWRCRHGNSA